MVYRCNSNAKVILLSDGSSLKLLPCSSCNGLYPPVMYDQNTELKATHIEAGRLNRVHRVGFHYKLNSPNLR